MSPERSVTYVSERTSLDPDPHSSIEKRYDKRAQSEIATHQRPVLFGEGYLRTLISLLKPLLDPGSKNGVTFRCSEIAFIYCVSYIDD